ncbi:MAG: CC0125/CC1285 family lipoprotein [Hyphomonas sp.]
MKQIALFFVFVMVAACASAPVYGPAESASALGYKSQPIEDHRFRVSYSDSDPERARNFALLRAAEVTLEDGQDWFEITHGYAEADPEMKPRSSVSIGGSSGSRGHSSVGVGIGIGFPIGGGQAVVTEVLEIVTRAGEKPDEPNAYDARSVIENLSVSVD